MVEAQAEAAALAEITPDAAPVVDVSVPAPAEPEAPASMDYEIQQGDTLSQIVAEHYGLTKWADIQRVYETVARNNGIEDPDKIYTGNNLVLFDDPTVDLGLEGKTASSDFNVAFTYPPKALLPQIHPKPLLFVRSRAPKALLQAA